MPVDARGTVDSGWIREYHSDDALERARLESVKADIAKRNPHEDRVSARRDVDVYLGAVDPAHGVEALGVGDVVADRVRYRVLL